MNGPNDFYSQWLGIPQGERPPDHYELLGIRRFESDRKVISEAADQRMIRVRGLPVGQYTDAAQRLLNEIATAKVCLLNSRAKVRYDAQLKAKPQRRVPTTGPAPSGPQPVGATAQPKLPPAMQPPTPVAGASVTAAQRSAANQGAEPRIEKRSALHRAPEAEATEPGPATIGIPLVPFLVLSTLVIATLCALIVFIQHQKSRRTIVIDEGPPPIKLPEEAGTALAGKEVIVPEGVVPQAEDGHIVLPASMANVMGGSAAEQGADAINWTDNIESVEWELLVSKPGIFMIEVTYGAGESAAGSTATINVHEQTKRLRVRNTGGWDSFATDPTKMVIIKRGGRYKLVVKPDETSGGRLMNLKSIRLRQSRIGKRPSQ